MLVNARSIMALRAFLTSSGLRGGNHNRKRAGGFVTQTVFAGRAAFADAADLIDRFGDYAASEAALRASRSRDLGNVIHFCRWREVERMIDLLRGKAVSGALN
jgi:hypothetical protein